MDKKLTDLTDLTRKRDTYYLHMGNKMYEVDIANKTIIGLSKKPIKSLPFEKSPLNETFLILTEKDNLPQWRKDDYKERFSRVREIFDRIVALDDITVGKKIDILQNLMRNDWSINEINFWNEKVGWKEVLSFLKTENLNIISPYFIKKELDRLIAKYNLDSERISPCFANRNFGDLSCLESKPFRASLKKLLNSWNSIEKARQKVLDFLQIDIELAEKILCADFKSKKQNDRKVTDSINNLIEQYKDIQTFIKKLGLESYKIENIENDYNYLKSLWEAKRVEIENKRFLENQTLYNLHFENDDYEITIPKTYQDCTAIGKIFHNCAGGWEWNTRLINGDYFLVCVKDKKSDKFVVCVDIQKSSMIIGQYLKPYNDRVTEQSLLDFETVYQDYLLKLKRD